jgi:NAD-dependent deacetylase
MKSDFAEVGRLLGDATRVLFITGAGVSAESQIPTFRGATAAFADGMTEDGIPFEEALSGTIFQTKPELSWKYLSLLEQSMRGKAPNAAHRAMAALQTAHRHVCIATQNIDGLHQQAGSKTVLELHGNIRRVICTKCQYSAYFETFESLPPLPRCPQCNAILRPDVVLYEEHLPGVVLDTFEHEQEKGFDLVFSVGTTSLFHYVTQPVWDAARRKTPVVEINPEETPVSDLAEFRFREPAGQTLQQMMNKMEV